jgi:16S rRNA processing protein RimM
LIVADGTKRLCLGAIAGAHGVRGAVRIKTFTAEPQAVAAYGPVSDETGSRSFTLRVDRAGPDHVIAHIAGITDRRTAEGLKGTRLYVERRVMPEPAAADEYYAADLIGAAAEYADGRPFGNVSAVYDFGAGDVLEVQQEDGASVLLPFTRAVVPAVDLARGRIVVDPPDGLIGAAERRPPQRRRAAGGKAREHA